MECALSKQLFLPSPFFNIGEMSMLPSFPGLIWILFDIASLGTWMQKIAPKRWDKARPVVVILVPPVAYLWLRWQKKINNF